MTVQLVSQGRGTLSKTATNSRKTRLIPIEEDIQVSVIVKEFSNKRDCIRFLCNPFPYLIEANWNEDYEEIGLVSEIKFEYPSYKYTKNIYFYDDIQIEKYDFVFYRIFFVEKNIINYQNSLSKIIKIKTGL